MTKPRAIFGICSLLILLLPCSGHGEFLPDETSIIPHVRAVRTWNELQRLRGAQPDDGIFAEGYSEVVVRLLARKWDTLSELEAVILRDPSFRRFVLKHIDASGGQTNLFKVERNARERCAAATPRLCQQIATAAARALGQPRADHRVPRR